MDFDDLDDAIDQRIEEGDLASLEVMGTVKEKAQLKKYVSEDGMTPIPRDHRLPEIGRGSPPSWVRLRAFVFYGVGKNADVVTETCWNSPEWLDFAVYEWPGRGRRQDEPALETVDALADDAFDAIKPAMQEVKLDGPLEGAPFAFIGFGLGAQVMTIVAKKVFFNYQIEPSFVVILDRAPLEYPLLSEAGQEALKADRDAVLSALNPDHFQYYNEDAKKLWAKDLEHCCEVKETLYHKFDASMLVVRPVASKNMDNTLKQLTKSSVQYMMVTLKIEGSDDQTMQVPLERGTKIGALKDFIGPAFSRKRTNKIQFLNAAKDMLNEGQLAEGTLTVQGLDNFDYPKYPWPHPTAIIGTGFLGVKMGMIYSVQQNENIILFDRHDRAGGDAWTNAATKHSRIQTDFGAFNIWFGHEYTYTGDKGWGVNPSAGGRAKFAQPFSGPGAPERGPFTGTTGAGTDVDYHPCRAQVLNTMNYVTEEYGFADKIRYGTEVVGLAIKGGEDSHDRKYELTLKSLSKDAEKKTGAYASKTVQVSVIYHFPGAYDVNRLVTYPGEKDFGGQIGYGMGNGQGGQFVWDDGTMQDSRAAIVGNGAFAIENVRSCAENGCAKIYCITRRKSLACPRIPCWFCHQGPSPTPAHMLLNAFKPMYEAAGMESPYDFYAVNKMSDTNVKITQSSRFGIGDVTFLCHAYGIFEYRLGTIEKLTHKKIHIDMKDGTKDVLEGMEHLCKALGLTGDPRVDKLHNLTHRMGNMLNGDWRRILNADATGMDASRFTTFSAGPGACSFAKQWYYLHQRPWDFYKAFEQGMMKIMPKHTLSNTQPDQPVYLANVQYEMAAGGMFGQYFPEMGRAIWDEEGYMYGLIHEMHPTETFLEYCRADWDRYQKMFKEHNGCKDKPDVPYPYSREMIDAWFIEYNAFVKPYGGTLITSAEGPSEEFKQSKLNEFREGQKQLLRDYIPLITLDKLHADRPAGTDPYALGKMADILPKRQKFTASAAHSAQDYNWDSYDEWKICKTEEQQFFMLDADTDSNGICGGDIWSKVVEHIASAKSTAG